MMKKHKIFKKLYFNNIIFYNSLIIIKLINKVMINGKKVKSYKIVYDFLKQIKFYFRKNPILLLQKFLYQIKVPIELQTIRRAGKNYKLPTFIENERQIKIILSLLARVTRLNKQSSSSKLLFKELFYFLVTMKEEGLKKKKDENNIISLNKKTKKEEEKKNEEEEKKKSLVLKKLNELTNNVIKNQPYMHFRWTKKKSRFRKFKQFNGIQKFPRIIKL